MMYTCLLKSTGLIHTYAIEHSSSHTIEVDTYRRNELDTYRKNRNISHPGRLYSTSDVPSPMFLRV
jgi:hypothetical protein